MSLHFYCTCVKIRIMYVRGITRTIIIQRKIYHPLLSTKIYTCSLVRYIICIVCVRFDWESNLNWPVLFSWLIACCHGMICVTRSRLFRSCIDLYHNNRGRNALVRILVQPEKNTMYPIDSKSPSCSSVRSKLIQTIPIRIFEWLHITPSSGGPCSALATIRLNARSL